MDVQGVYNACKLKYDLIMFTYVYAEQHFGACLAKSNWSLKNCYLFVKFTWVYQMLKWSWK